jgi:hypothetical protein
MRRWKLHCPHWSEPPNDRVAGQQGDRPPGVARTSRPGGNVQLVKGARLAAIAAFSVMSMTLATPANADPDTDFANQLHTYGIYGPRDYNAWLGKIACERLHNGVDGDAYKSQKFVASNLPRGSTQVQAWQFLGSSITFYCPDQTPILQALSAERG